MIGSGRTNKQFSVFALVKRWNGFEYDEFQEIIPLMSFSSLDMAKEAMAHTEGVSEYLRGHLRGVCCGVRDNFHNKIIFHPYQ